ncbi:hypothetical protein ACX12E_08510 [Paenibacillus vandeheii]
MVNKRHELRRQLNEICLKLMEATDPKQIKLLKADRDRLENKIKKAEGRSSEENSKKRVNKYIGYCPLCWHRIMYGESYIEHGKMTFCNNKHYKEYIALRNEK